MCPRLLDRSTQEVAKVLLHEMLHQGLGVGDRRHPACESRKQEDTRCYRESPASDHGDFDFGEDDELEDAEMTTRTN